MIDAGIIAEDERIELVEGELVVMAAKGYAHELVRAALTELLSDARPEGYEGSASESTHATRRQGRSLEPDLALFARAKRRDRRLDSSSCEQGG